MDNGGKNVSSKRRSRSRSRRGRGKSKDGSKTPGHSRSPSRDAAITANGHISPTPMLGSFKADAEQLPEMVPAQRHTAPGSDQLTHAVRADSKLNSGREQLNSKGAQASGGSKDIFPIASVPALRQLQSDVPTSVPFAERIAQLTGDLVRLRRNLEQSEAQRLELKMQLKTTNLKLADAEGQQTTARLTFEEQSGELGSLRTANEKLEQEVRTLAQALDKSQQQHDQQALLDQQIYRERQEHTVIVAALESEVRSITSARDELAQHLEDYRNRLKQQQLAIELTQEQDTATTLAVNDLSAQLDRVKRSLAQVEQERNSARQQVSKLQQSVTALQQRADVTPDVMTNLHATLKEREEEVSTLSRLRCTLEERCAFLEKSNQQLRDEADRGQDEQEQLQGQLQAMQAELNAARSELSRCNNQHLQEVSQLRTDLANAQDEQRRGTTQLAYTLAQCHRDVLDTIQVLSQGEHSTALTVIEDGDDTNDIIERLRSGVEQVKRTLLLRDTRQSDRAQELEGQAGDLQIALQSKQAALDTLQRDLHARTTELQNLHSIMAEQQADHDQVTRDYRRQAQATQQLLNETEAVVGDLRARLESAQADNVSASTGMQELQEAIGSFVYTTHGGDKLLEALSACTSEHQRHAAYLQALAHAEEDYSSVMGQLRDTMQASQRHSQALIETQSKEQMLRSELQGLQAQVTLLDRRNQSLEAALEDATHLLAKERAQAQRTPTPQPIVSPPPRSPPRREPKLPVGVKLIIQRLLQEAQQRRCRTRNSRDVHRLTNAVLGHVIAQHDKLQQLHRAMQDADQAMYSTRARRRWRAAFLCITASRLWHPRDNHPDTIPPALTALPWSDDDESLTGLTVEQQVAWQRLLRACQRTDNDGWEWLTHHDRGTARALKYLQIVPSIQANDMSRQLSVIKGQRDELQLQLEEISVASNTKQQDLQQLAEAVATLRRDAQRHEQRSMQLERLVQQQQNRLDASIPVEQHGQVRHALTSLQEQHQHLQQTTQQQQKMLQEAERQLHVQRDQVQAELAKSISEKSSIASELKHAKQQIEQLQRKLDRMERAKEDLLLQLQGLDRNMLTPRPIPPLPDRHPTRAGPRQSTVTTSYNDRSRLKLQQEDDLASLMSSALGLHASQSQ
eukprot:TRINITY_DN11213_c0_g1_i2.p1 TRINITY_DN11213_c0_g1~~TRINITY_DN11213_c0_g1_i2.p1  ORF type:complete len:1213 (+),score=355.32 TRINITY_DN11213_c0_g1_i2:225-3641(+)